MPIIIDQIIPSRSWEAVRDRVATILKEELFHQSAITYNDWINCDVYADRWKPVGIDECTDAPLINVTTESAVPTSETWIDSNVITTFNIVVSTAMSATAQESGDTLSSERTQAICGIIQAILMHPLYVRLGFAPPFIIRRRVSDIKFGVPERQESANITLGIVTFEVTHGQDEPTETGLPIGGYSTSVTVNETNKGLRYEI